MLTDAEIKKAVTDGYFIATDKNDVVKLDKDGKPKQIAAKLDGDNLLLEITDNGTACWRFRYVKQSTGKPTRIGVGIYPATGVKQARKNAEHERDVLARKLDPIEERQKERDAARATGTLEQVITE